MKNIKNLYRLIFCAFLLILFGTGCKTYSLESIPYVMTGDFVMEENSPDYSICVVDIFLLNKSEK